MKYKTSLKCEGCLNSVRKGLDNQLGEGNWSVDLSEAVKHLEVADSVELDDIKPIFERVGHSIQEIDG